MDFTEIKDRATSEWQALQKSDRTRIYIGTATCGRASGAMDILNVVQEELAANITSTPRLSRSAASACATSSRSWTSRSRDVPAFPTGG